MTIAQMTYILAVEEHKNFVIAAEKSFVSQPALSMQIQKVESELGIKIFDRSKNPVEATPIGKKIIEQAKITMAEYRKIKGIIANERDEISGELRLGIIPTLAPYLLPLFLKEFVNTYPKIQLNIRELTTDMIIKSLREDDLDIGLMATPIHQEELKEKPIFYEELMLYVSPRNEVFSKTIAYTEDIDPEQLWLLEEGHCLRSQIAKLCALHKNTSLPNFKAGSLETLIRLVDRYDGMTVLPELAIRDFSEERAANVRHFASPSPVREISLVFHQNYPRQKIIEGLFSTIKTCINKQSLEESQRVVLAI